MIDLTLWNDRTAFAPSVLGSGVAVGGFEVACEQIASGIAATGREVWALTPGPAHGREAGVWYQDCRGQRSLVSSGERKELTVRYRPYEPVHVHALLTARACSIPDWIHAKRTFTTCVDDPRFEPESFEHLKGRTTIIALSDWQADLYRALGHERVIVIPSMIADDVASYRACEKTPGRFVCVNAWNKGTDATLAWWARLRRRLPGCKLHVGSPYSHPPDAQERCAFAGATWLGQLTPAAVIDALSTAEAVFRVCERPETFGVCDAIAEIVGARVHALFTNGLGASRDVLTSPWLTEDREVFEKDVLVNARTATRVEPREDYRVSTVIRQWERVLFG